MRAFDREVFADYHQFYVWDAGMNPQAPEDFTADDIARRVIVRPHVVVVQPVRNDTVPVRIEIHDADPGVDLAAWDHVVECGLDLPTGRLQVHECTGGPVLDESVTPGTYCVRVLFAGLGGGDRYTVALWPGTPGELQVRKRS